MITEKMLKDAIIEADNALLESLDENMENEHVFSKEFENKMEDILRTIKPRNNKFVIKAVACAVMVLVCLGSSILIGNTELRAAFSGWIKTQYNKIMYYYLGTEEGEKQEYINTFLPEYLPDGFEESGGIGGEDMRSVMYTNDAGQYVRFMYTKKGTISIVRDNHKYSETSVGEYYAELYIAEDSTETNKIIWMDEEKGIMFCLAAFADEAEIIKMAESVIEVQKIKGQ